MRSNDGRTFTEGARRAQIVACAIDVVAELGYAQTSIRKIADRVGVAMSVVLYHFATKEELVRTIVAEAYQAVVAEVAPRVDAEPTAAGKLAAYLRASAAFIDANRTQFMAMLDIGLSFRSSTGGRLNELPVDPELLEDLVRLDLDAILRLGRKNGEFRPMGTRRVAVALRSALNGAVLEIAQDPEFDVRAYGEELVTLFDVATRAN